MYPPQVFLFRIMVLDPSDPMIYRRPSLSLWMFRAPVAWTTNLQTWTLVQWQRKSNSQATSYQKLNQRFRVNLWVFQYQKNTTQHRCFCKVYILQFRLVVVSLENLVFIVHPGSCFWLLPGWAEFVATMAPKAPTSPLKSAAKSMVAPKAKAEPKAGKLFFFW